MSNITERKRGGSGKGTTFSELTSALDDLQEAKEAAEASDRTKRDFLANMSHELKTPLNHIIGFSELILNKQFGELNESQAEYLGDVLHSSRHLLSLINDILDLSKVESGKLELELSQVRIRELLESSLSRKYQGTGLGLALCRQLVELHGGRIWAESEGEGQGCRFVFELEGAAAWAEP